MAAGEEGGGRQVTAGHGRLLLWPPIISVEPAVGRILRVPLLMGWSDILIGLIPLDVVGIIALYDRRTLGSVHPATKAIAAIVIAVRLTIYLAALTPPVIALADRLVGG